MPLIKPSDAVRIIELHDEGYRPEHISQATGVPKSMVLKVIASPKRYLPDASKSRTTDEGTHNSRKRRRSKCGTCGALVFKPCLLCRRRSIGRVTELDESDEDEAGPLPGDPTLDQIREMAAKLRRGPRGAGVQGPPGIREYWTNDVLGHE